MAWEMKDMSGTLFKNDKRESDSHPHARGDCLIDGVAYWVSAWTKEGKNGKFQSLAFKRKDEKQAPKPKKDGFIPDDDPLPF
jgi:hypothetical protein